MTKDKLRNIFSNGKTMKSGLKRIFAVLLLFFFIAGQLFPTITANGILRFSARRQVVRQLSTPADMLRNRAKEALNKSRKHAIIGA